MGVTIPTSFADVQQMLSNMWTTSPLAVGIVVGLLAVGTFKLLSNEISPESKTSHTLEKHEKRVEKREAKKAQ